MTVAGATRALTRGAVSGRTRRMRAACWLALASLVLGAALIWVGLREPLFWMVPDPLPALTSLPAIVGRALFLAATAVCALVGVGRRAVGRAAAEWLIVGLTLAAVGFAVDAAQRIPQLPGALPPGSVLPLPLPNFGPGYLLAPNTAIGAGFWVVVVVACGLALSVPAVPGASAPAPPSAVHKTRGAPSESALILIRTATAGSFVVLALAVVVAARVLIVPEPFGLGPSALVWAVAMIAGAALPLVGTIAVSRGSELGRLLVSAVALVLVLDATGGFGAFGFQASPFVTVGYSVMAVVAVLVAAAIWLPSVSRWLAGDRAGTPEPQPAG
ncbi:MAG TPA: hypothetical protein VGO99_07685 [Leifsonia sp.]|nr:hypothetical protein [Leifsonia sp.]